MEIHLERDMAEKRIFPAIDIYRSGTRREELLLSQEEISISYRLRKLLSSTPNQYELTEKIINKIGSIENNQHFIDIITKKDSNL